MRIPIMLNLGYKNFKCKNVWFEEESLTDERKIAMARCLGVPETEVIFRWEVDECSQIDLAKHMGDLIFDLYDLSERLIFKDGSIEEVKDLFLKYGPLFSGDRISVNNLKDRLCGFYLLVFIFLLNQPDAMGHLEDELLKPWEKMLDMLKMISGQDLKVFSPVTIRATKNSWPVLHVPDLGSLKIREDIIRYFDREMKANAIMLIKRNSQLKVNGKLEFNMYLSDAFTFIVANMVFGKSKIKLCKCGCGLPAYVGEYYDNSHKRKNMSTATKQKVIRYFYKMLDAKNNPERHEKVKDIINKLYEKGITDEGFLKEKVREALNLS